MRRQRGRRPHRRRLGHGLTVLACVALLAGCQEAPSEGTSTATPEDGAGSSGAGTATPSTDASAPATPGPDEVLAGCSDADAEELGDVVVGADLDGDGGRDVVRVVPAGSGPCAGTVLAYLPDRIVGMPLPADGETEASSFVEVRPDTAGPALVAFRTTHPRGGYQTHLVGLADRTTPRAPGGLGELSAGGGAPLLPFVATDSAGTRAGFVCAGSQLVAQVAAPDPDSPGGDRYDVETTPYDVAGIRARPGQATSTTGVAPDQLFTRFPALDPDGRVVVACAGGS